MAGLQFLGTRPRSKRNSELIAEALAGGTSGFLTARKAADEREAKQQELKLKKQELELKRDELAQKTEEASKKILVDAFDAALAGQDIDRANILGNLILREFGDNTYKVQVEQQKRAAEAKVRTDFKRDQIDEAGGEGVVISRDVQRGLSGGMSDEEIFTNIAAAIAPEGLGLTPERQVDLSRKVRSELSLQKSPVFQSSLETGERVGRTARKAVETGLPFITPGLSGLSQLKEQLTGPSVKGILRGLFNSEPSAGVRSK